MPGHRVVPWPVGCVVVMLLGMAAAPVAAEPSLAIGKRVRLTTVDPPHRPHAGDSLGVVREDAGRITLFVGGEPVTWTKHRSWLQGNLLALDRRHVIVRVGGQSEPLVIRREDVAALDVWDSSRSRADGALAGAAVGLGLGVVMGLASGDDTGDLINVTARGKAFILAILLTPVGALIGYGVPPKEDWRKVPLDWVRMSLGRTADGQTRISMNVSF